MPLNSNIAYIKRRILWKAANKSRSKFVTRIVNLWKRNLRMFLEDHEVMAVNDAMRITYVEVGGKFGRAELKKQLNKKAFGDINDELDQRLANYTDFKLGTQIASIKDTSMKMYLDIMDDETLTAAERIDLVDEMILRRARFIAQNEIVAASNVGREFAIDAAMIIEKASYVKTWIATIDNRVRDGHEQADGQTVKANEAFWVSGEMLQYPKDSNGSPGNTINCRCVLDYQKLKI